MASPSARIECGSFTADGSEITVSKVGFKPKRVELVGANNIMFVWHDGLMDGYAHKTVAAGTRTTLTSAGIAPTSSGFTLGADGALNVAQQITYCCWG